MASAIILSITSVSIMGYLTQTMVYDIYGEADMQDIRIIYGPLEIQEAFDILGNDGLNALVQMRPRDFIFPWV